MVRSIFVTLAAVVAALGGLLLAATSGDIAGQVIGIVILVLAWAVAVGYHARRTERAARVPAGPRDSGEPVRTTLSPGELSMMQSLVVTILFGVLGLVGLLMAAGAHDGVTQIMGLGILLLSWFLIVGFHARRAEQTERARAGAAH